MGTKEKLIKRFESLPKDFTFDELASVLTSLGYERYNKGKTSGSRVCYKSKDRSPIMLHKPHPGNIMKRYAMVQVLDELKKQGLI